MLKLRHPEGVEVDFFQGRGWSPACRHNHAVEQGMAWGADHLVILGADQVYEPDLLERLMARRREGYEVVAALVPTRGGEGAAIATAIVYAVRAPTPPPTSPRSDPPTGI